MEALNEPFQTATDVHEIPGVTLAVANGNGSYRYRKSYGKYSLHQDAKDLDDQAVFWIASASKFMGVVAVLKCVEQGLFKLEDEVADYLPEWKDPEVLEGWTKDGKPILRKAKRAITIRMLIIHSSGQAEPMCSEELCKYMDYVGENPDFMYRLLSLEVRPLLFHPGEGWMYSPGIDWAGKIIMKVSSLSLEEYMQRNIFQPLNMHSTTFHLSQHPEIRERLVDMTYRADDTSPVVWTEHPLPVPPPHEYAGGGLYTSASDFLEFMLSLLRDDGRILSDVGVQELFSPQLEDAHRLANEDNKHALGGLLPEGVSKINHALVGILNEENLGPFRRKRNSLTWAGGSMIMFWIDRESGLCALYASQVTPEGHEEDIPSLRYMDMFEQAVYREVENRS